MSSIDTLDNLSGAYRALVQRKATAAALGALALGPEGRTWLMGATHDAPHVQKAAVAAFGTGDVAVGTMLVGEARKLSILGRLRGRVAAVAPNVPTASFGDATFGFVAMGSPVPAYRPTTSSGTPIVGRIGGIVPVTVELLRQEGAAAAEMLAGWLARSIATSEDAVLLDAVAGTTGVRPAGLRNGVTGTSAGSPEDAAEDIRVMLMAVRGGRAADPVIAMTPNTAIALASAHGTSGAPLFPNLGINGGTIYGVPVMTTLGLADGLIVAFDAAAIAVVDDGLTIDFSDVAAVEQLDNPTNNSATVTATATVSAFQTNARLARIARYIGWRPMFANAVAYTTVAL